MNVLSPPVKLHTCVAGEREPGIIYFTTRPGGVPSSQAFGWIIGVDQSGHIVLNRKFDGTSQDIRCQNDGTLLFSQSAQGLLYELDTGGAVRRTWHARGKWRDKRPPHGSIELPVEYIHHTVNFLPNGNFLILDAEQRKFEKWFASASDRLAPRVAAALVGDVVCEFTREGALVRAHRLFDILDPYRITHGSHEDYWRKQGFPDAFDWSHANAVCHDPHDDTLIVSVRHQDCIIKIGREDGKLRWILGNPSEWKDPWKHFLLKPEGDLRWQFHQHDCSVTGAGRVLCFDNGNYRAGAFETPLPHRENFSRGIEFEIDDKSRTVRQIWEYGESAPERIYGCYQGGARRLPKTGNTLLTFGGICLNEGAPSAGVGADFGYARLIEVTMKGKIVFDLSVDDSESDTPLAYSAFRSDHYSA